MSITAPPNTVSWTSDPKTILGLAERDDVDGFLARKHSLQHYTGEVADNGLLIIMRQEWFKTLYAVACPRGDNAWGIRYAAVCNSNENDLAGLVALGDSPLYVEVSVVSAGPRHSDPREAAGNVLRRIVNVLEVEQRNATFQKMFTVFEDLTIISASLQHGWRTMSGSIGGRRFVIEFGKVRPDATAKVTLYPYGILRPARHEHIFTIPVSEEDNRMSYEELAIKLLQDAYLLEAAQV
jgi:hypothetical protein